MVYSQIFQRCMDAKDTRNQSWGWCKETRLNEGRMGGGGGRSLVKHVKGFGQTASEWSVLIAVWAFSGHCPRVLFGKRWKAN